VIKELLISSLLIFSLVVPIAAAAEEETEAGSILVEFEDETPLDLVDGEIKREYENIGAAEISVSDVSEALSILNEAGYTAEPDYTYESAVTEPDDPHYEEQWGMEDINMPETWDEETGSEDVVVAVLDSGIDYHHEDLQDNMWEDADGYHGYNAVNDTNYPIDTDGHGTHAAGIIGAVGDNEVGVAGVNWNVSLMSVKVLEDGEGSLSDIIDGMDYVLDQVTVEGENVVATSNSWAGVDDSELLKQSIEDHRDEGILFVCAAGNDGKDIDKEPVYPASYDLENIISVGSYDEDGDLATHSNHGRSVDVGAPGVSIYSTLLDDSYGYRSGTSMAVPHVSGLAALLHSNDSTHDYLSLKNVILHGAQSRSSEDFLSGYVDAYGSITTESDSEDANIWIYNPLQPDVEYDVETEIQISVDDQVDGIMDATVTAEFDSEDEDALTLMAAVDGYYTTNWTPNSTGEVEITIEAEFDGLIAEETVTYRIQGTPMSDFYWEPDRFGIEDEITFYEDCEEGDYPIQTYEWDLGDGNTTTGQQVTHSYPKGTFNVTLTITDGNGMEDEITYKLQVEDNLYAPSNPRPRDGASRIGLDVTLSIVVEHDNASMDMEVTFIDRTGGVEVVIGTVHGLQDGDRAEISWTGRDYSEQYEWQVIVEDEDGNTERSSVYEFTTMGRPDDDFDPDPFNILLVGILFSLAVTFIAMQADIRNGGGKNAKRRN